MGRNAPTQAGGTGRLAGSEHRLLWGYAPLALLTAVVIAAVAVFPSRAPEAEEVAEAEAGTEGSTATGWDDSVTACTDRDVQVDDDPYSPPCFEFDGDNGGATTQGVTADTITVSYRRTGEASTLSVLAGLMGIEFDETTDDFQRTTEGLIEYFNESFQLYGRKMELVPFESSAGDASVVNELVGGGQEAANNDAIKAGLEIKAFADITGVTQPYAEALTRQKVVNFGAPYMSREWFTERRPYSWSLATDCSRVAEAASATGLKQILDRPAIYAGGELKDQPRRIAVISPSNPQYQECTAAGLAVTREGGKEPTLVTDYVLDLGRIPNQAKSIVAQLVSQNITTISCFCDPFMLQTLTVEIDRQGLEPEWTVAGVGFVDLDLIGQGMMKKSDQWTRAFGATPLGEQPPREESAGYQAFKSVRPDEEPSAIVDLLYYQLYQLALGLQMAGPELTPTTFETGMFSYPETTGPAGAWDYRPESYTPIIDARQIWWDPEAISPFNGEKGSYVGSSERYRIDQIPEGQPEAFTRSPLMSDRNLLIAGGLFVAVVIAGLLGAYDASLGIILQGIALGLGTGLMAVGLVLIYRTTRIINFAYGAMGTVAGALASGLTLGSLEMSWFLAAPIAIAAGVVIGLLVELLIIRRFTNAPRLVLTVATIGLAQALGGLAIYLPDWLGTEPLNPGFSTPLSDTTWTVGPVTLDGNTFVLAVVAPLVLIALGWFLFRTRAGVAVRGMAENLDRARLLGLPVNRLNMLLWSITGGLAAITVVLKAPTEGVAIDAAAGPTTLLAPLAAAVLVGMRSIPGAFLAGVALEVMDQLVQINADTRTWTFVAFLAVIVVGLFFQERKTGRAEAAGEGVFSAVGVVHHLPRALARLPEVRGARILLGAALVAALAWIPLVGSPSQINYATVALIYAMAAVSLVVLSGWAGVVSLGQFALVGVGGIIAANLIADRNADLFVTIAAATLAGGVVAAIIGIPALRVSGELLAVTTLAFAVVMQVHVINPATYADWVPNDYPRPELFGWLDLTTERWLYVFALVLVVIAGLIVTNLRRARTGRTIAATRDNERSASATGISPVRTKITAFVLSGMVAGAAGAIHAVALRGLGSNTYEAADSLLLFSMVVIGGLASLGGTLGGVALIMWLGYAFPRAQLLLTGVGVLLILLLVPGGLGHAAEQARDWFAHAMGRRRGVRLVDQLETVDLTEPAPEEVEPAAAAAATADAAAASVGLVSASGNGRDSALLTATGVESGYGSMQVLFGIDCDVEPSEVLALLGTNGAGKSTLFKALVGLLPTWNGSVSFDGHDITGMPTEQIARRGLAMMPGGHGTFPTLTVAENLRLASWLLHGDAAHARQRCDEMVAMFPVLRERWDEQAGNLSGGEQQQLSIAMAFVTEPKLVLIDELSLGLAPTIVSMLVDRVRKLAAGGTTVVVVEQSINVALLMCEQAVFMEKGQVRFRGPTSGLLDRPDILRAVFIGGDDRPTDVESAVAPPEERANRGVTLECHGLTRRFGGITAVDEVDLVVRPGQILGLIGHNGAGKTTLFDVLTGFLEADDGRVELDGTDITGWPPHRRAVMDVGRSFQEARLYPSLTVSECVRVALERHLANRDPVAAALRLPASTDSERSALIRADEVLALLGLEPYRDRPTGELSTGTRRLVELACLLAQDPAVILLDEPTAGVAQAETEALVPLLRRLQAETGCSLVVIEHDMGLLSQLCDEFVALEQGRVIARGTPDEVLADPQVIASYLGTDEGVAHRSGSRPEPAR